MEAPSIQKITTYNNYNEYRDKDISTKKNANKGEAAESKKAKDSKAKNDKVTKDGLEESQLSGVVTLPITTRVSYSIESDLNLVVTQIVDTNTKEVIRQIPPEEVIKRMRLLKNYHQPVSITKGVLVNDVME